MTGNISILSNQKENKVVIDENDVITVYTTEPNANIQINNGKLAINFPVKTSSCIDRNINKTEDNEKQITEQVTNEKVAKECSTKDELAISNDNKVLSESDENKVETCEKSIDSKSNNVPDNKDKRIRKAFVVNTSKNADEIYGKNKKDSNNNNSVKYNYKEILESGRGTSLDGEDFKVLGLTEEKRISDAKIIVEFIDDRSVKAYKYGAFIQSGVLYGGKVKKTFKVGQKIQLPWFKEESTIIRIRKNEVMLETSGYCLGVSKDYLSANRLPAKTVALAKKNGLLSNLCQCRFNEKGRIERFKDGTQSSIVQEDSKKGNRSFIGGTTGVTKDGYAYKVVGTKTSGDKTISVRLQFVLDRSIREVSYEDYIKGIKYSDAKGVSLKTGSSLELPMFKHRCSIIREEKEKVVLSNFDRGAFTISKSDLRMGTIPEDILDSARRANALRED